jgi:alkylation response protein AidB-like acyl-CoA dehydrogenase
MATTKASFHWDDPLLLDQQLSDDERAVRDAAQTYCQERLQTRVLMAARHESFDRDIMTEMGSLGLLGRAAKGNEQNMEPDEQHGGSRGILGLLPQPLSAARLPVGEFEEASQMCR